MKLVPIKSVVCYTNGKRLEATQIGVVSVSDNLIDDVTFKYTLLCEDGVFAGEATHRLQGESYKEWDASAKGAYELVCKGIGVEIVGINAVFGE
jgi:hypothetical protein